MFHIWCSMKGVFGFDMNIVKFSTSHANIVSMSYGCPKPKVSASIVYILKVKIVSIKCYNNTVFWVL